MPGMIDFKEMLKIQREVSTACVNSVKDYCDRYPPHLRVHVRVLLSAELIKTGGMCMGKPLGAKDFPEATAPVLEAMRAYQKMGRENGLDLQVFNSKDLGKPSRVI